MSETRTRLVTAVILVAAGSGQRLGYGMPKAAVPLGGEPILMHALRGIVASGAGSQVCVALPPGDDALRRLCEDFRQELADGGPLLSIVDGGSTRADSVRAGMAALMDGIEAVLVHDAARALTPESVFHRVTDALAAGAAAVIPAVAVVDTVKTVAATTGPDSELAPEVVTGTAPREELRAVQTPQGFQLNTLLKAHEAARALGPKESDAVTDDAMLVEMLGIPVHVVRGSTQSLKITTPLDLILAEGLLEGPLGARWVEG
ncbi:MULTISPECIES: 2-C-methyl-D-erythritol 4-phosphate cytidylyltransferase [Pseudarthrobacter]|jgi:2-C-methyl-D-erythritol 4-phosphate cytidylyltransferase|uniref:2-C-methyl-D-erythritol 4-phosphate cytidylyltransferase n=1 Tax=Pseudarthrobacter TaxID=1742993 RepID=UPI002AA87EC8|nr:MULTISPECIES: 2-C-methyl-D-erythritol 4-phosphate cytidylyltransferase [Pseudarthrobacter]MEA3552464.1 2-C-methyl-D-erythritol 4-phosphate cytidylyltransferase [Pseudarthrobacter sp. C1]WPU10134.1 2-C-methyl-D-erythritol 4-phosphate cytidylyltransferase [Pseudarthrobacter oxydans]HET7784266.1 2-C-methyl-D-erythritol 4-phosphate cytidylyltransferase [Arthrobacter sp.]